MGQYMERVFVGQVRASRGWLASHRFNVTEVEIESLKANGRGVQTRHAVVNVVIAAATTTTPKNLGTLHFQLPKNDEKTGGKWRAPAAHLKNGKAGVPTQMRQDKRGELGSRRGQVEETSEGLDILTRVRRPGYVRGMYLSECGLGVHNG